jgi:hypothetical protein
MVGLFVTEGAMDMFVPRGWYSASSRLVVIISSILMGGNAALSCLLGKRSTGLGCR